MFFLGQFYLLYCYLLSTWIIRRSREWKTSVTRFGEISPLWNILKVFRQFFLKTFSIWQNFEPTLANSFANWSNKRPNIEKYSKHLVTLLVPKLVISKWVGKVSLWLPKIWHFMLLFWWPVNRYRDETRSPLSKNDEQKQKNVVKNREK